MDVGEVYEHADAEGTFAVVTVGDGPTDDTVRVAVLVSTGIFATRFAVGTVPCVVALRGSLRAGDYWERLA